MVSRKSQEISKNAEWGKVTFAAQNNKNHQNKLVVFKWLGSWEDFVSVRWIAEVKYPQQIKETTQKLLSLVDKKIEVV